MSKAYDIPYNDYENDIFSQVRRGSTRQRLMSLYTIMLKIERSHSFKNIRQRVIDNSTVKGLVMSYSEIRSRDKYQRRNKSDQTYKNRIEKLIKLGLVTKHKDRGATTRNRYTFNRLPADLIEEDVQVIQGGYVENSPVARSSYMEKNDILPKEINDTLVEGYTDTFNIENMDSLLDSFDTASAVAITTLTPVDDFRSLERYTSNKIDICNTHAEFETYPEHIDSLEKLTEYNSDIESMIYSVAKNDFDNIDFKGPKKTIKETIRKIKENITNITKIYLKGYIRSVIRSVIDKKMVSIRKDVDMKTLRMLLLEKLE